MPNLDHIAKVVGKTKQTIKYKMKTSCNIKKKTVII